MSNTNIADSNDLVSYKQAILWGAVRGAGVGLVASLAGALYLKRKTQYFHGAGGLQRSLVFVAPATFGAMVNMERTGLAFEDSKRDKEYGKVAIGSNAPKTLFHENIVDWLKLNKYKIIVGGWIASIWGSYAIVNRDKYMTKSQKIVQARVYAQGITVAMLLASVLLSVTPSDQDDNKAKALAQSKSWEDDLQYVQMANEHGDSNDYILSGHSKMTSATQHNLQHTKDEVKGNLSDKTNKSSDESTADNNQTGVSNEKKSKPEAETNCKSHDKSSTPKDKEADSKYKENSGDSKEKLPSKHQDTE